MPELWWIVIPLLAAGLGAVAYLRRDRYPRFMFNAWAPTIYALLVLADLLLAALLTWLLGGGSRAAADRVGVILSWATILGLAVLVIVLFTLFFRWVTNTDMSDIPK